MDYPRSVSDVLKWTVSRDLGRNFGILGSAVNRTANAREFSAKHADGEPDNSLTWFKQPNPIFQDFVSLHSN